MTKQDLREYLKAGYFIDDAFDFKPGQECDIFRAEQFKPGDEIIYIPDVQLSEIPMGISITDDEMIDEIVENCYTGNDFIKECNGDREKAERLFWYCDWQHPSAALGDGVIDDDEEYEMEVKRFATTGWSLGDVVDAASNKGIRMTSDEAAEWWGRNESSFMSRMVEYGNKIISELLDNEKGGENIEQNI